MPKWLLTISSVYSAHAYFHTHICTYFTWYSRCRTEIITYVFLLQMFYFFKIKTTLQRFGREEHSAAHPFELEQSMRSYTWCFFNRGTTWRSTQVTRWFEVWLRLCQSGDFPDVGRWAEQDGTGCALGKGARNTMICCQLLVQVWNNFHGQHWATQFQPVFIMSL